MGQVAEVSMSCDSEGCECTGSSDSGTIIVFENQSTGSLVRALSLSLSLLLSSHLAQAYVCCTSANE